VFEETIGRLTSKQVYTLISEYLVVAAETVPGLWRVLKTELGWDVYSTQATRVCDGYLRKAMYATDYGVPVSSIRCPSINIVFPRALTPQRALHMLANILGVRQLVPVRVRQAYPEAKLGELYRAFRAQPKELRIHQSVLVKIGIDPVVIAQLQTYLCRDQTVGHAKRALTAILGELGTTP
jgi:hypothetical protein